MKKILLILTLLFSVVAGAMAQNNAIYVYRNDGEFNAFLKSEVDSMRYSHLDADSVYHNDWQMQEVFTADSVYRIPVAAIDSVSFVTPEPVYKQDVKVISDEWTDYVISYTDSTILFSSSIPQRLLPKVGYVVAVKAGNVTFPDGFAGKMEGVQNLNQNIQANFSSVQLQDVYSLLVSVGSAESYNSDDDMQDSRQRIWGYGNDVNIKFPHELGFEVKTDNASFSGKFIDPSLQVDYIICIDEANLKDYVQFKYRFDSDGKFTTTLKKEGESLIDAAKWSPSLRFAPFGVPCSLRVGAFIKTESSIELNSEFPFHFNNYGGFEFDESYGFKYDMLHYGMRKLPSKATFNWKEPEWSLSLNGSLYAGFALEFGIGLAFEKVKVAQGDVTIKTGLELSSSFNIASNEGIYASAYEALKDTKVDLAWKTEATLGYCAFLYSKRQELPFSLSFVHMKRSTPLLPEVSSPTWKYLSIGKGTLGADVSNDTFMPCQLGWALYDGDKLVRKDYIPDPYWFSDRWPLDGLQYTYRDLPSSFSYKAYPLIKLLRMEIRVPESVDMRSSIPTHITDFKVTKSYHNVGAYTNDGRTYDYKFDAATTVELDPDVVVDMNGDGKISAADFIDIEDWGYAYEDPDGKITHISLKNYSSPYTDTRYAYYRNSARSTARLYGYVRYKDSEEYCYDAPQDYPLVHEEVYHSCPDNHHPHLIDLGLPSGTKWACCNVGASKPDEYGGYYAWGETSEKDVYNEVTYSYDSGQDTDGDGWYDKNWSFQNIGSDIAGTSYDVAHVYMGGLWRMPSLDQQMELMDNCKLESTQQNGVYGFLMIGHNGGQLFLPLAGYRWASNLDDTGDVGYYWSSSFNYGDSAYDLYLDRGYMHWYISRYDGRCRGHSVRAVCP